MTCEHVEPELVAFHFGLADGDVRTHVEAHLAACGACLRAYLAVKRAIETGENAPRPSSAARARLRRAVARELHPEPRRAWWERPVAVAVAASIVLAASATTRALTTGAGAPPHALSDRGR